MVCFTKIAMATGCALALSFVFYGQKDLSERSTAAVEATGVIRQQPTSGSVTRETVVSEPGSKRKRTVT